MIRASFSMGGHFHMNFFSPLFVVYLHIMALYSQWAIYNIYDALKSVSLSQCERLFAVVAVLHPPKDIDRFRSLRSVVFFSFSIKNNFLFESIHTIAPGHSTRSTVLSTNQIKTHTKWSRDLWKSSQIIGYLTTAHARTHTCICPSIRCKWTLVFPL